MTPSWISVLPPVVAILLAIRTKLVLPSLLAGIFCGVMILQNGNVLVAFPETLELLVQVVSDPGNARLLLFSLLIGAIVFLVEKSGGVRGFVRWASQPRLISSERRAGLSAIFLGSVLFLEGSISILTVGTVARPIFDRFRIARAKLAYIADATCAPIAVLIPLNGWGAYLITQFEQNKIETPAAVLLASIPFFFYPLLAYLLVFAVVCFGINFRFSKEQTPVNIENNSEESEGKLLNFLVPILSLIFSLFVFMFMTGKGNFLNGEGSKSILYATSFSVLASYFFFRLTNVFKTKEFVRVSLAGMNHLLEVVMILVLAFGINQICKLLGTGPFIASIMKTHLPATFIPVLLFLVSAIVSFSTGTSWGTFAIMLAIALPAAESFELSLPLIIGAVVSGGVWGDHSSPISDTTVLASLASECDLMDHVKTQMPYALIAGGLSALLFLIAGILHAL